MSTTYVNKGFVKCKVTGKIYEDVKLMEISQDGETLFWNGDISKWCKWEAVE